MARLPRLYASETLKNIGVIKADPNAGAGLAAAGRALSAWGERIAGDEMKKTADAERAYLADLEVDNRIGLANMADAFRDDPAGFEAASKGHIDGALSQVPEHLRDRARSALGNMAAGHYTSILNRRAEVDRAKQDDALTANADAYLAEWMGYADSGMGADPRAIDARARYADAIDGRVANDFISADRAKQLIDLKDSEALARTYLAANKVTYEKRGFAAAWAELNDLATDERIDYRVRRQVIDQRQTDLREEMRAEATIQEQAAKFVSEREEETAKAGWTLQAEGALTKDWVLANRKHLGKTDYVSLLNATKPGAVEDEVPLYDAVQARIFAGEDVTADIVAAERAGQFRTETARTLISQNRAKLAGGLENPYETALRNLSESFDPGPFSTDPVARRRKADAVETFKRDFTAENDRRAQSNKPPLTADETFALRDTVRDRFSLIAWEETSLLLPKPRFFVGTRSDPNIAASETALVQEYRAGRIDRDAFDREAAIIERWRTALEKRPKK